MTNNAATVVQQYLDNLPADRRAVVATVRDMILRHLPVGYQETMRYGMISTRSRLRATPPPTMVNRLGTSPLLPRNSIMHCT